MFVLPAIVAATIWVLMIFANNSVELIFMPFSNKLFVNVRTCHNPNSLSLTFCIKVATVLAQVFPIYLSIIEIFVFDVSKAVFDGFKFRLKKRLKFFSISYSKNGVWKNLEAIVNYHHFLAFSLHDLLKTLMCRSWCLIVASKQKVSLEGVSAHIPEDK